MFTCLLVYAVKVVLFGNLSDNLARVADRKRVGRYVARNHAACAYYATVADSHAADNGDVACKPTIISYFNGLRVFVIEQRPVRFSAYIALLPTEGVDGCNYHSVRSYKHVVADFHRTAVKHSQIKISIKIFACLDIRTVVAEEGTLNISSVAGFRQQFFQYSFTFFNLRFKRGVILCTKPVRLGAHFRQSVCGGVVNLTIAHFVKFCHTLYYKISHRLNQAFAIVYFFYYNIYMSIVTSIFKFKKPMPEKLLTYGFIFRDGVYTFTTFICGGLMKLTVNVGADVQTEVYDVESEAPYTLFLVEGATGEFVGKVRAEYIRVLEDVAEKCFVKQIFNGAQTAEVVRYAHKRYGNELEFLWDDTPDCAILRRGGTNKWYAVIMTVAYRKLGLDRDGTVEAINVRIDPAELDRIADGATYFRGWHMNKKRWTTMLLDGSVPLDEILQRLDYSYQTAVK